MSDCDPIGDSTDRATLMTCSSSSSSSSSRRDNERVTAHIEICIKPQASSSPSLMDQLRNDWQQYLESCARIDQDTTFTNNTHAPDHLQTSYGGHVSMQVQDVTVSSIALLLPRSDEGPEQEQQRHCHCRSPYYYCHAISVHVYVLSHEETSVEELEPDQGEQEWTAACEHLTLPHVKLQGLWESLLFPGHMKQNLLDFAATTLLFTKRHVSSHLVHWNRLILLHGPAGTGKTSCCRALAQKLAIRLNYSCASLLEIHSHSLFSKWFSTSGKLVHRLFDLVQEIAQDEPQRLVCVLIDEIESLASSRQASGSSGEPTDAIRAVNSLLTSLDRLRSLPNVLVLATTNLTERVDSAFIDRADMKVYIGPPCWEARYEILRSCIAELQRVGIIQTVTTTTNTDGSKGSSTVLGPFQSTEAVSTVSSSSSMDGDTTSSGKDDSPEYQLRRLAEYAEGLSGRSLRRLPVQAHALFLRQECVSLTQFQQGLERAIGAELESNNMLRAN